METMWEKFDAALRSRGVRQGELEELLDYAKNRITKWKAGQGELPFKEAFRIAQFLRINLNTWADDARDLFEEPAPEEFTSDERAIIDVFRGAGLSRGEAIEALLLKNREAALASESPVKRARK